MTETIFHDVWIIDPKSTRPPYRQRVTIQRTRSEAWAILPGSLGKRKIGATAFFVKELAVKRWQGNLDRMRKSSYLKFHLPNKYHQANDMCTVNVYSHSRGKS